MLIDLTDIVFMVKDGRIRKRCIFCRHRVDSLCISVSQLENEEESQFYTL